MNTDYPNKSITIVAVTGHQDYAQSSIYSIERSYEELQKKIPKEYLKCLLISPQKPEHCPDYIEHLSCKPFSDLEYNLFMIYSLGSLIDTDFALIVQNDGFVVNGDNWQNEFLEYDYIGAPVMGFFKFTETGVARLPKSEWDQYYQNTPDHIFEIQNGGFSLRSKKLLTLPAEMKLITHIYPLEPVDKDNIRIDYSNYCHHEDFALTIYWRKRFLDKGIKYAPSKLAAYFAVESPTIAINRKIPAGKILGCHTMGLLTMRSKNELYMAKKVGFNDNNIATNDMCHWLLQHNIEITVPKKFLENRTKNETN